MWGGRAVCKSTGQNSGLRQGGVRWQVEGASRDGAGGGKAMGGREGPRGREKKKRKKQKKEPTALPIPSWSPTEVLR